MFLFIIFIDTLLSITKLVKIIINLLLRKKVMKFINLLSVVIMSDDDLHLCVGIYNLYLSYLLEKIHDIINQYNINYHIVSRNLLLIL